MIKILNTAQSLNRIIDRMNSSEKTYFTRFGDNDIMMMSGTNLYGKPLGKKKYGGNRTMWSEALQKELINSFTIEDPNYLRGVSCRWDNEFGMKDGLFASFNYNRKLQAKINQLTNENTFLIPVLFHYLITFKPNLFNMFVNRFLRPKRKLFIGNVPPNVAAKILGTIDHYVQTPQVQAYDFIDRWYPAVEKALKHKPEVIIPCCGQSSRVLQGRFWRQGVEAWSIDMGSMFDPLAGRMSRTCWKLKGKEIASRYE